MWTYAQLDIAHKMFHGMQKVVLCDGIMLPLKIVPYSVPAIVVPTRKRQKQRVELSYCAQKIIH